MDGRAKATGDAVDQARRLARERLLDDKRVLRVTDTSAKMCTIPQLVSAPLN